MPFRFLLFPIAQYIPQRDTPPGTYFAKRNFALFQQFHDIRLYEINEKNARSETEVLR